MKNKFLGRIAVFVCFFALSIGIKAQNNIITDLETSKVGEGTVRIVCDPKIIKLLGTPTSSPRPSESDLGDEAVGYRIQIYMGNSPKSRNEAIRTERLFNESFADVASYVRYTAPNWKVLVGDFRTREEADIFKQSIQSSLPELGREMYVVPSRINLQEQK